MAHERDQRIESVLILPGDVRYNLGDTAICLAILGTLRNRQKLCELSVHGDSPLIDGDFAGVSFNRWYRPRGLYAGATADLVIWGGGQLLQGNRSRLKVPYWFGRIGLLRLLGRAIIGVAQGVGPLRSRLDRWMTRKLVGWSRRFSVRDPFSEDELLRSGVPAKSFQKTADPAILLPQLLLRDRQRSRPETGIDRRRDPERKAPQLGLSLRFTLHHRDDRLVPFQLLSATSQRKIRRESGFDRYLQLVQGLAARLALHLDVKIVLIPMYLAPWETDQEIAQSVLGHLRARGVEAEIFEPRKSLRELLVALDRMEAFIGTPMHSTILSTAMYVPTCALYYEPKGRSYFESIGAQDWTYPLERLVEQDTTFELEELIGSLWQQRASVRHELAERISARATRVAQCLERLTSFREDLHPSRDISR